MAIRPHHPVGRPRQRSHEPADPDEPGRALLDRVDAPLAGPGSTCRGIHGRGHHRMGAPRLPASRFAFAGVRPRSRHEIRQPASSQLRRAGRAARNRRLHGECGHEFRVRRADCRHRYEYSACPVASVRRRGIVGRIHDGEGSGSGFARASRRSDSQRRVERGGDGARRTGVHGEISGL